MGQKSSKPTRMVNSGGVREEERQDTERDLERTMEQCLGGYRNVEWSDLCLIKCVAHRGALVGYEGFCQNRPVHLYCGRLNVVDEEDLENIRKMGLLFEKPKKGIIECVGTCVKAPRFGFVFPKMRPFFPKDGSPLDMDLGGKFDLMAQIAQILMVLEQQDMWKTFHPLCEDTLVIVENEKSKKHKLEQVKMIRKTKLSLNLICFTARLKDIGKNNQNAPRRVGVNYFLAPEYVLGCQYNCKSLVFSYGILCFMILHEKTKEIYGSESGSFLDLKVANDPAFRPKFEDEIKKKLNESEKEWIIGLCKSCWLHNSSERPSFEEIVNSFMTGGILRSGGTRSILAKKDQVERFEWMMEHFGDIEIRLSRNEWSVKYMKLIWDGGK